MRQARIAISRQRNRRHVRSALQVASLAALCAGTASAGSVADWRDLHARCGQAVSGGTALDTGGLQQRPPTLAYNRRLSDGRRTYLAPGPVGAAVPKGIWAHEGGQFELRLIEYPTQPGTRTICEVIVRRGTPPLSSSETLDIEAEFTAMQQRAIVSGRWQNAELRNSETTRRMGITQVSPNPRGCPVIASLTIDPARDVLRSAVSEQAGVPSCGGLSLFGDRRTDL